MSSSVACVSAHEHAHGRPVADGTVWISEPGFEVVDGLWLHGGGIASSFENAGDGIQFGIVSHVVRRGAFRTLMHLAFRQQAGITDLEREVLLSRTHLGEGFGVFRLGREVVDFIGIALQVVEFFGGLGFLPEDGLLRRELAFIEKLLPNSRAGCFKLVADVLRLREMRHVVPQVRIVAVGDAAHAVIALIHATTEAIDEGLRRCLIQPGESVALHPLRRLNADDAEQGGREIDEAHEAVRLHAGTVFLGREVFPVGWEINDHRHLQAGVARPALVARHAAAVIGIVENDGVSRETGCFEFLEALPSRSIGQRNLIIILRPILPHFRRVGVIRWHADLGGIVNGGVRALAELAFVTAGLVEDGEEGLTALAVLPRGFGGGFVPHALGFGEVVVLLAVVGAVITSFTEELRIHLRVLWHLRHAAHVLTTGGGRIHAHDDRRARSGADGGTRPRALEQHALGRQCIHIRRGGISITVAAHVRAVVFAGEPEDVGLISRKGRLQNAE